MKKLLSLVALAAVATLSTLTAGTAQAQFGLPSIPGVSKLVGGGSGGASADLGGQQDALVRNFVAANKDVLTANSKMADALGLKQAAAKSKETSDSLTEGATKDSLEAANREVAVSTQAVAAEIAKQPVLDAQAKATYAAGLVSLVAGASKYMGVGRGVKDMGSSLSSASPLQLPKLQPAVFVVSNFPASMNTVSEAVKTAVSFARSQGIPVSDDATAFLASK